MPKRPATNENAAERYAARRNDIARLLDVLQMELDRHAEEAKADPKDWGRTGDLDLVRHNLIDIVAFISGAEMEREDVERFLAEAE
jgi:uncharacterized alpha-E superfamily protein